MRGTGEASQDTSEPVLNDVKIVELDPGAASDSESFNPAGVAIAVLTGLLAALVGTLFWVNKRHGAKAKKSVA